MSWKNWKKQPWIIRTWSSIAMLVALVPHANAWAAEAKTRVILNGETVAVFFNDGDSFRVLSGTYKDARARLSGYNTLESYGPAHQWGTWTAKELYVLAKMATKFASRRVWTCTTDGKSDTYGRMLVWCPELAKEQVSHGYGHVLSVTDDPADIGLIEAQKQAIADRRGMWAHGVPDFIVTSLHSREEDIDGHGTYNRLVSTEDGHSVKWRHTNFYQECENVCHMIYTVPEEKIAEISKALRNDPQAAKIISSLTDEDLRSTVHDFGKYRHINRNIPEEQREELKKILLVYIEQLGSANSQASSCMIHVPFKRRFGGNKAACLK